MTRTAGKTKRKAAKARRSRPAVKRSARTSKKPLFDEGVAQEEGRLREHKGIVFHFDDVAEGHHTVIKDRIEDVGVTGHQVITRGDSAQHNGDNDHSGKKVFASGATRSGHLEERYDLMSAEANRRRALVYGYGAVRHGDRNWEKGLPVSECINRAIRHLNLYLSGDQSEDHLGHAAVNCDFAMHYEKHNPDCIDIPSRHRSSP